MKRIPRDEETKLALSEAKQRFTPAIIIEALVKHNGWISAAAKELDCNVATISRYIRTYPEVQTIQNDLLETRTDKVEKKLQDLIDGGNPQAVIFYLKTQARHRGYTEKLVLEVVPFALQQKLQELCVERGIDMTELFQHIIDQLEAVDDAGTIIVGHVNNDNTG